MSLGTYMQSSKVGVQKRYPMMLMMIIIIISRSPS